MFGLLFLAFIQGVVLGLIHVTMKVYGSLL